MLVVSTSEGGSGPVVVDDPTTPVVLRWPTDRDRAGQLAQLGIPRLLLVDSGGAPPVCLDPLEDWVRLPTDERDIDARLSALRARALRWASPADPQLDGHGRLLRGHRWVPLSPTEEALCGLLVEQFNQVVSDRTLRDRAWPEGNGTPTGLRLQMTRLRRRIADIGLEIRSVRGQGYVLQNRVDAASD